jgi:hypothetical protein
MQWSNKKKNSETKKAAAFLYTEFALQPCVFATYSTCNPQISNYIKFCFLLP